MTIQTKSELASIIQLLTDLNRVTERACASAEGVTQPHIIVRLSEMAARWVRANQQQLEQVDAGWHDFYALEACVLRLGGHEGHNGRALYEYLHTVQTTLDNMFYDYPEYSDPLGA